MLLTKQPAIEDAYLATGLTALAAAEQVILGYFGKDLIINQKSNQSPVTIADKEAEQVIKKAVLNRKQNYPAFLTRLTAPDRLLKNYPSLEHCWLWSKNRS